MTYIEFSSVRSGLRRTVGPIPADEADEWARSLAIGREPRDVLDPDRRAMEYAGALPPVEMTWRFAGGIDAAPPVELPLEPAPPVELPGDGPGIVPLPGEIPPEVTPDD